jgi:threonine/homoserine/homoserine lactone efflux protein
MERAFVAGVVAGYGIAIPIGAIGIIIIDAGVRHGLRTALAAGAGAATADLVYAAVAALFGAALAQVLEPYAVPLRVASIVVLVLIAVRGLAGLRRESSGADEEQLPPSVLRTYLELLALTLLNPMTVAYFAALILGLSSTGSGPGEKAAFVVGAGLASLSWQWLLAFGGSRLHRRMSPRLRLATGVLGNVIILALAALVATSLVG